MKESLLMAYVSDLKGDGTYTLNLDEAQTKKLWDEIDELELELEEFKGRACAAEWASYWP